MLPCESESGSLVSNSATPWTTFHGILQARILEWVAFPFSRGSSQPKDWTRVSRTAGGFFTSWATREAKNTGVGGKTVSLTQCHFTQPSSLRYTSFQLKKSRVGWNFSLFPTAVLVATSFFWWSLSFCHYQNLPDLCWCLFNTLLSEVLPVISSSDLYLQSIYPLAKPHSTTESTKIIYLPISCLENLFL